MLGAQHFTVKLMGCKLLKRRGTRGLRLFDPVCASARYEIDRQIRPA